MKTLKIAIFLLSLTIGVYAQDSLKTQVNNTQVNVYLDVVSSFVWRGTLLSNSLNLQPLVSITHKNIELGFLGSTDFIGKYREVDYYLSYKIKNVIFKMTDYNWFLTKDYFNYNKKSTEHVIEGTVGYNGGENFPLSVLINTFIYGSDKKFDTIPNFNNNYSTFIEVSYAFKKLNAFIGITPNDGFYGDGYGNKGGFAFCNVGISSKRDLIISKDLSIPIKGLVTVNPQIKSVYFTITASL